LFGKLHWSGTERDEEVGKGRQKIPKKKGLGTMGKPLQRFVARGGGRKTKAVEKNFPAGGKGGHNDKRR